ncbi:MAG: 50S ribosomal protein L35 [bacterium]
MPKLKTHKATAKRIRLTAKKKLMQRYTHQDHFNARDTGNKTRKKRRDVVSSSTNVKKMKKSLPYQ